jgi:hypothetical protein
MVRSAAAERTDFRRISGVKKRRGVIPLLFGAETKWRGKNEQHG